VCAVRGGAAVSLHPHGSCAAGEHALDAEAGPAADAVTMLIEEFHASSMANSSFAGRGMYTCRRVYNGAKGVQTIGTAKQ